MRIRRRIDSHDLRWHALRLRKAAFLHNSSNIGNLAFEFCRSKLSIEVHGSREGYDTPMIAIREFKGPRFDLPLVMVIGIQC